MAEPLALLWMSTPPTVASGGVSTAYSLTASVVVT
jgi:hypothetical protein